jgi:hypothetical protein
MLYKQGDIGAMPYFGLSGADSGGASYRAQGAAPSLRRQFLIASADILIASKLVKWTLMPVGKKK